MGTYLAIITFVASFLTTLLIIPYWIKRAKRAGLVGEDKHKKEKTMVAELGGLPVVCGFLFSVLVYIAVKVFIYSQKNSIVTLLLATTSSILIATVIGIVDDILGWKIGLRRWHKIILTLFIALPIMVVNAGVSKMNFPFFGVLELSLMYPLIIVPLGIIGASNGFNMLAGYNGLEAGMGMIILSTLGIIAYFTGSEWVCVLAFAMVFALFAFLIYNRHPARIFPGDTLTYSVGALIAIIAILANIEKFALMLFIPYYIEFILKARGKMEKESFARLEKDSTITMPYKKIYGLEHLAIWLNSRIKKKVHETDVVYSILFVQLMISCLTLAYFFF